jgi:hypothetical protein
MRFVMHAFNGYPLKKSIDCLIGNVAGSFDMVFFFQSGAWVSQPGGKVPVVGKKNQAAGHVIKPANIVHSLADFPRQQLQRQGTALRV